MSNAARISSLAAVGIFRGGQSMDDQSMSNRMCPTGRVKAEVDSLS